MKKSQKKILAYFEKMGWNPLQKKPNTITWAEIGNAIGLTEHGARNAAKRYRLDRTASLIKLKEKEDSFMEELDKIGFVEDLPEKKVKILLYDLETSPNRAFVWKMWKENINPLNGQLISDWFCLTWSAKWLFADEIMSDKLTPDEVLAEDDSRVLTSLWQLINEADIIIGHNASRFDVKRMNTRFLKHRLTPPTSYQVIDTLDHARKRFAIVSNRLDYLGEFLGVGRKIDTNGFELWARCMKGEAKALKEMQVYCDGDIRLLEAVYLEMLPWIQPHPNVGLYVDSDVPVCPSCGSDDLKETGSYVTTMNTYPEHKCNNCGANSRSRKSNTPKQVKERLTSSLPK